MTNSKNKNVIKGIFLYIINVLCLSPIMIYGGQNFSIDSYGIVLDYNTHLNAFIGSYRWFGAFVYKLYYDMFKHNPILDSTIDCVVYIVFVAAIVLCLSYTIYSLINKKNALTYVIINLSVLISVLNVWFCDILSFPECVFITAIGVFLCFSALIVFIKIPNIKGYILSALLIILSTGVYQQFLFVFTIYIVAICSFYIVKNKETTLKQLFLRYIKPVVLIIMSGGLYFAIGKIAQLVLDVEPNSRVALSISSIIENCFYFAKNQHSYLKGRGFFYSELLTMCFLAVSFIWFVITIVDWKKNKNTLKTISLWLSYAAAYISAYAPGILSTSHAARAMFALFAVFSLFVIGTLVVTDSKYVKAALCAILCVVLVANTFVFVEREINQKKQNEVDRIWAEQIIENMEEYENEYEEIKQIYYCYDSTTDIAVFAETAVYQRYSLEAMINYYSDRGFKAKEMSLEEKEKYFGNKEWTEINIEEQLIFVDDSLYLCCY